jgi:hypothetical protein
LKQRIPNEQYQCWNKHILTEASTFIDEENLLNKKFEDLKRNRYRSEAKYKGKYYA